MPLDAARLTDGVRSCAVLRDVRVLASVASTMDTAATFAGGGADEGVVILADEQTAGRGRHGRTWHTPPGVALAVSVLFRPDLPPERLAQIPMAVALAALDALTSRVPDPAALGLKWPNDVLVGDAKIAGLLAEVTWSGAPARPRVVVGLGLNVGQAPATLPEGATSVAALWGDAKGAGPTDHLDRTALAIDLLRAIDAHYTHACAGADLVPAWSARLTTLGRTVVAHSVAGASPRTPEDTVHGRAVGVTTDGALRIATEAGEVVVRAGDVTLSGAASGEGESGE